MLPSIICPAASWPDAVSSLFYGKSSKNMIDKQACFAFFMITGIMHGYPYRQTTAGQQVWIQDALKHAKQRFCIHRK